MSSNERMRRILGVAATIARYEARAGEVNDADPCEVMTAHLAAVDLMLRIYPEPERSQIKASLIKCAEALALYADGLAPKELMQ